jgi:flagellar assembly protein FliH
MNSSKIFKKDSHFTAMPLVQRNIAVPAGKANGSADPNALYPTASLAASNDDTTHRQAPQAEPEPLTPVDLQAIQKEAYDQGVADTARQYQLEVHQTVKALAEACQKFDDQRKKLLAQNRGDIVNLIIALSKKILGQELATPRNIIATTLENALQQSIASEEYYVTLHPDDLAFAESKAPEFIAAIRGLERLVFKTDASLTRGGCLLESLTCSVDATIETQVESMKEFLQEQPDLLPTPSEE